MKVIVPTGKDRLNLIAPLREILSTADVLEIIEPVVPDKLMHIGDGVYEGQWQDEQTGVEEIARLANMDLGRVVVISEAPGRPEGLPTWISVQFCIIPLPMQRSEELN